MNEVTNNKMYKFTFFLIKNYISPYNEFFFIFLTLKNKNNTNILLIIFNAVRKV